MDNRGKRQAASIFGGMGFYIALLVCVVAAGVVGYYALKSDGEDPGESSDPMTAVDQTEQNDPLSVSGNEDDAADPVLSQETVTIPQTETKPEIPKDVSLETGVTDPEIEIPVSGEVTIPEVEEPQQEEVPVSTRIMAPLVGTTVSVFSANKLMYDPTLDDWRTHDGIDITAEAGTQVVATAAGTVIAVGEDDRLGVNVVIEHSGGYVTTYASLHPETLVEVGDSVEAGTVIGVVGNTSLNEAGLGAHLHFAVSLNGEMIDPESYLPREA